MWHVLCVSVHVCMGTYKFMQFSKSRSTSDIFIQMFFVWDSALNSPYTPSAHPFSSFHSRLLLLSHESLKLGCFQFIFSLLFILGKISCSILKSWASVLSLSHCCPAQHVSTASVTSQLYKSICGLLLSPSAQPLWLLSICLLSGWESGEDLSHSSYDLLNPFYDRWFKTYLNILTVTLGEFGFHNK